MYRIQLKPKAKKQLLKLDRRGQHRITLAMKEISANPFKDKKLEADLEGRYTFRVWPYRIIYRIYKKTVTIMVVNIGHRQGVYKR